MFDASLELKNHAMMEEAMKTEVTQTLTFQLSKFNSLHSI